MRHRFFIHDDIEKAAKYYHIPLHYAWNPAYVYILQEDRCVFVGSPEAALSWIGNNDKKYCKSLYPLRSQKGIDESN